MPDLKSYFSGQTGMMVSLLSDLMTLESPTADRAAVNRMGARLQSELAALGAAIEVHPREQVGDIVVARWHNERPGKPIIFVCHMDTVHPLGALARNPIRQEDGRLFGPGANDEKGGIVTMLAAIRGLQALGHFPERPLTAIITTDEETGSAHSRALIEELAARSALALITEAALSDGALKTWRKSPGFFRLQAHGSASHSGSAPEAGVNAVEEMANQILRLQRLTDYKLGTTVSVNRISGGTAQNVVPAHCEALIDARAATQAEIDRITGAIYGLEPFLPGARVEVSGGFDRPPMERTPLMLETFETARGIAARHGLTLRHGAAGGASDGNFTAALGVPTLDGVGPTGLGAHTDEEHVIVRSLGLSATLLAALVGEWPHTT